ncbi:MAG TPA: hypothetical protein VMT27_06380 [Actinomycetes bacterium]|nr:hypothetical protein [Actinomycetes bacterium]
MTRIVKQGAILAFALVAAASLSACQAGQAAQTNKDYQPVDGRNVNVPSGAAFDEPYLAVRDALVIGVNHVGSLIVTVVNNSAETDTLESVTISGDVATLSSGPIPIRPNETIHLGFGDNPTASIDTLKAKPGDWVDLTMNFTNAGSTELQVLVLPIGDKYE